MRRARLLPLLIGLLAAPLFMVFVVAGEGSAAGGVLGTPVLLALVAVVVWALRSRRGRRGGGDVGWAPPPTIDLSRVRPAGLPARGSVTRALAPVEWILLATNAWFAVGVGFCILLVGLFAVAFPEELEASWWGIMSLAPMLVHPLTGGIVVAAHRGVTRSRRDGTDELFTSCPAGWGTRTRAHLAGMLPAALASGIFLGVFVLLASVGNPHIGGRIDTRELIDLAIALVLPAGGVALGVALGRWAPWTIVPFVAVALVGVASSRILTIGGDGAFATGDWLSTFMPASAADIIYFDPPGWARVVWFVALTGAVSALALMRGTHSRRVPLTLAGSLVVAVVAASVVMQPLTDAQAAEQAALISDVEAHQTCTPVGSVGSVCVYDAYRDRADAFVTELEPVAAALPPGVPAEPAVFRQFVDTGAGGLPAPVADLLEPEDFRLDDLRLRFYAHPDTFAATRMRLAAYAVGLPTEAMGTSVPTVVAGQARGVLVLWLGTRGLDPNTARKLVAPADEPGVPDTPQTQGDIWPGRCYDEEGVLVWAPQDLEAARLLIDLPAAAVHDVVVGQWDRWIDPETTTDDLLAALGADPVGPPDHIVAFADTCG